MLSITNRPRRMNTILTAIIVTAITTTLVGVADAQRGGGGRLPGDVELEKGPLAADDFEKNALAVLANILENQRYRNVPEYVVGAKGAGDLACCKDSH